MRLGTAVVSVAMLTVIACGDDGVGGDGATGGTGSTGGTDSTGGAVGDGGTNEGAGSTGGSTANSGGSGGGTNEAVCPPTGPADVGVVDASLLVASDRIVVSESGTVVENVDVNGDIEIVDGATDVTIRNFRITTNGYWGIFVRDGSNVVIEDGEIDGLDGIDDAIRGASYTARRLYIHDIGGDGFKADGDNVIECNYVTAIGQAEGAHGDGIQMMGNGDIEITRNNFDLTSGELTACIFPFGAEAVSGPVHADENRLTGGAYIVYCHENLHMTNNVFGEDYAYGPVTDVCGTWEGNTWEATGEPLPN
ncbi:MAG: right-handed parallel beta-helix repeat-containing protein [Polyangiaceae bacterium]|nr:right-handed parallel beta-helix repeat-containing protein [Polyangiaceae bacterium]